jgi:endonuclease/exonuclease/phosphatase family metal-dependent hydrolase
VETVQRAFRSAGSREARKLLYSTAVVVESRIALRFRVMTYNVHRCVGAGGQDSIADIVALCADADADVIALQELDAPESDDAAGPHHARDLATHLGMKLLFCRTFKRGVGYYGHALLSRYPLELRRVTIFPTPEHPRAEPRGAIWARVDAGGRAVDIISTHLGPYRAERAAQSRELVGDEWLGHPDLRHPCILCGDFNALPDATTYRRIAGRLRDAQRVLGGHRPRATFPARLPLLRLDHVFVSPDVRVLRARVPWNARSRRASDHLPLVVDLDLP